MPFVQGKCENCGGILAVDTGLKAAICPFCGTAYIVQDSINYYNSSIKVENMHADVVNITDESSSEARLKAAEAYMKIGDYSKAKNEYLKVTEIAPHNYLGWLGIIDSHTHHYSRRIRSSREISMLEEYAKSVLALAPIEKGAELLKEFRRYVKAEQEQNDAEKSSLNQELAKQSTEVNKVYNDTVSMQNDIVYAKNRVDTLEKSNVGCGWLIFGVPIWVFGIILTKVFFSDGDWYEAKISLAVAFVLPCYILGIVSVVLTIKDKIKNVKNKEEINILNKTQKELVGQISINNAKIMELNNAIRSIEQKLRAYN